MSLDVVLDELGEEQSVASGWCISWPPRSPMHRDARRRQSFSWPVVLLVKAMRAWRCWRER